MARHLLAVLLCAGLGAGPSPAAQVLLVDKWLLDPVAFTPFYEDFPQEGLQLHYRRFHPTLVEQDTADFDVLIVAGGLHPRSAATHLIPAEGRQLTGFIRQGGTAVFLVGNGPMSFAKPYLIRNHTDNYILNTVLDSLGLKLRIEGDAVEDPTGLKSTILPWSAWLPLPWVEVDPGSLLGQGLGGRLVGGRLVSLLAGQAEGIEVPAFSGPTSLRRLETRSTAERGQEAIYAAGPRRFAVVAAASAGQGHVIVAPRYLFNMNGYTGRWSDKPILPPYVLENNRRFARNFARYLAAVAGGQHRPGGPLALQRVDRVGELDASMKPAAPLADTPLRRQAPASAFADLPPVPAAGPFRPRALGGQPVRSAYVGLPDTALAAAHCRAYAAAGLNLLYVGNLRPGEGTPFDAPSAAFFEACRREGLKVMLWDYFSLGSAEQDPALASRLVDGTGAEQGRASPFDPHYWETQLRQRSLEMAALAGHAPDIAVGMLWDLEVYGHDELLVTESSSFDNLSFALFLEGRANLLEQRGLRSAAFGVERHRRFAWLEEQGLLGEYYQALEEEVFRRARSLRDEVEARQPGLLWGFYTAAIPQSWYYRGLFRGFASDEGDLLLITYEARGAQQVTRWASLGVRLAHAPGVLFGLPEGQEWVDFLRMCQRHEAGYWLFRAEPLAADPGGWRAEGLPDSPPVVLDLLRRANAEP